MSSIIKGQRIRNQSKLKILNKNSYLALDSEDENLRSESKGQKEAVNIEIQKAENKAARIIEKAKIESSRKAEEIIKESHEKTKKDSQLILEKAQKEGYSKGYKEGQLEAQKLIDQAKQVELDAKAEKEQILADIEPAIIEMVIGICDKLIDEEINFNPETILILIRKSLKKFSGDTPEITIKVSSDQYEYVLENKDLITTHVPHTDPINIQRDSSLDKGACIIETPFGSVACDVKQGFLEIQKQLRLICSKN